MRSRLKLLLRATFALATLTVPEAARAACTAADLAAFTARAQSADKGAVPVGTELVKCPALRDQAVFWQAFLLALSGDGAGSRRLDDPNPGRTTGSTKEGILARARAGQYKDLKARVDDQEPGYANAPNALLVLARVLTRKGEFVSAREAYVAYLRLVPDNDDVETELLFSYLWEGNYGEADSRFAAAARYPLRSAMAAAVQRGQALAKVKLAAAPHGSRPFERPLAGLYGLGIGAQHLAGSYQRRSARALYEGPVDLYVAAHAIDVDSLEQFKARASEARFGAHGTLGQTFLLKAHVGYFSPGSDHLIGDAAVGIAILQDLVTEVGATRDPLALQLPLTQEALDLMRDTLYAGVRYGRLVEFRSEIQKEKDYAAHELHTLLARVPVLNGDGGGPAVALRFPASLEVFPNPSPNYDSAPRTVGIGAGAELQRDYSSRWSLNLLVDYVMETVTPRSEGASPRNSGVLAAKADVRVPLDDAWKLTGGFRYFRADQEPRLYSRDRLSGITLGLAYEDAR